MLNRRTLLGATAATLAAPAVVRAQAATAFTFFYPIAEGSPLAAIIEEYCDQFGQDTGITVTPVFAGTYTNIVPKVVSAIKGGHGPAIAVMLAADIHALIDLDILVPLDDLNVDHGWVSGFYPAFLANSRKSGKLWSVPFQRSTAVDYYNKRAFTEAGLDPDAFPTTWDGLVAAALKLTRRDAAGRVTQWGIKLASDLGSGPWTFAALTNQVGHALMNEAGTEVYFNDPKAIEALTFWRSLAFDHKVTPEGAIASATLPADFIDRNAAIIQASTSNLANLRSNAPFPFWVGGPPGKAGVRTVVGGGNLYFMKQATAPQREAAMAFVRYLTGPHQSADWCIRTGYIAPRPDAWDTAELKAYVQQAPVASVAPSFVPVATGELSTFENQTVSLVLASQIQACLSGSKTPAQAMADAQTEADRILKPFRRG